MRAKFMILNWDHEIHCAAGVRVKATRTASLLHLISFKSDNHREIVAIELNHLVRRQMGPVKWGKWFLELKWRKNAREGAGRPVEEDNRANVAQLATEQSVRGVTARTRMTLAEELDGRPVLS